MKPRDDLTAKYVRECFEYDEATGQFVWRRRPLHHFVSQHACKSWNGRNAGKKALGCPNTNGYLQIRINKKLYFAHRLAWLYVYKKHPKDQLDHINCEKTDNRILNLREASNTENGRNTKTNNRNTSGFKGVSWRVRYNVWQASIKLSGKTVHLGTFNNPEDAHKAYVKAAKIHFGEFARAN